MLPDLLFASRPATKSIDRGTLPAWLHLPLLALLIELLLGILNDKVIPDLIPDPDLVPESLPAARTLVQPMTI